MRPAVLGPPQWRCPQRAAANRSPIRLRERRRNRTNRGPFIEIHPDEAERLGVAEDDAVEIASQRGHAVLSTVITYRANPGNCFAPVHRNDVFDESWSIQRRHP